MSCPALTEFDIGWICALAIEVAAASEMLDEKFEPLQEQDAGDSNIYTLGRIGNHNIAIACLPAGQYGTTSATTVAKDMLRTFSNSLRVGLMVGVGGGIPSPDHDIRLGDIVISCPDGTSGGVTQYDMGKISVGGKLQRTGSLNSPPRSLLAAVNGMRAAELTDDPRYPQYLQNAAGRTARTKKNFSRPDSRHDRLFRIEHPHPEATKNCDTCLAEWEEPRDEREDDFPQPFYGIIASGNVVIKDASTRESIRSETGALCFEMEAAGLMQDFPCIVIRGICDYSDSHKNKAWQGYAALAAASYAKELVETLPRGQVARERLATDICRSVQKLHEDVKGTNQRLDKAYHQQSQYYLDNNQRQCHQVFKTSIYQQYKDNNPNRERETCQWVLQDPIYLRWRDSYRNDLLLVSADPGCGKSVLAKSLIDHDLKKLTPSASICYFFFKDNELQNKLSIGLCAILHQLFSQQPSLLQYAIPSWEKNGHKLQDEVGELWSILLAATSHPTSPNTICVLDALDECHLNDRKRLIQELKAFYTSGQGGSSNQPPCLKFIVTSRPYADIISGFRDITRLCRHIHLSGEERNALIHKEIDLVVRIKVQELAEITGISQKVQEQVEQQLLKMEHRTYLWLHLAMDDIRTMFQDSLRPAEQAISLVPTSVSDAYARILERVPSGQEDTVRKIFQIIVGARRPLSTREMAMALGVATKPNAVISAEAMLPGEGLKAKLRRLLHLIHQTAKEFLGEYNAPSKTQNLLASVCMHEESDLLSFLRYSAVNWADHDLVYLLYGVFTVPFDLWFSIFELESSWSSMEWKDCFPWSMHYKVHAMHLAAFNGHHEIGANVNAPDGRWGNALHIAFRSGYDKIVQLLLENGAIVDAQNGQYGDDLQNRNLVGW
ncbi:uncharacterized protein BDW47DRAFT_116956 [Aspergillus candidus]|uniref:Uncharacterized protein n=1 Tax=Aspergillus candidus TaxID=41067 RepID=A0A2I2FEK9_ASPCN|nr:hypothetical protein BDW47DRAFT_116956 [Aspergillus candidus]PLB39063.1 hypothetical protein BDW47DRAFT_116956 [Aspergillus candidus]